MFNSAMEENIEALDPLNLGVHRDEKINGKSTYSIDIKNKRITQEDFEVIKGAMSQYRSRFTSTQSIPRSASDEFFEVIRFENCRFDLISWGIDFTVESGGYSSVSDKVINFNLEFIDCEFLDELGIESEFAVSVIGCEFHSKVKFKGLNKVHAQLGLKNVVFDNEVILKEYSLNDSIGKNQYYQSFFKNIVFHKTVTLDGVFIPKDMILEEVQWPNNIYSSRLTFQKLKQIMDSQHNFIDSAFFHSLELNEYRKELRQKNLFSSNWEDKLVFGFNWYASKFSLSWALPFYWIIIFSVIFYSAAMCMDSNIEFSINTFFQFMNPFSWHSKAFDSVYAIWFLHKIIVVPLVYLMIIAIKRKTKM